MEFQIYFFSCVSLILVGAILSYSKFGTLLKIDALLAKDFLENKTVAIISSFGALLFGLLLLLSDSDKDVAIVGNIIPAIFSLVGGTLLLLSKLNKSYEGEKKFVLFMLNFLQTNVAIIGLLMIILGIIHILFPTTPLL